MVTDPRRVCSNIFSVFKFDGTLEASLQIPRCTDRTSAWTRSSDITTDTHTNGMISNLKTTAMPKFPRVDAIHVEQKVIIYFLSPFNWSDFT